MVLVIVKNFCGHQIVMPQNQIRNDNVVGIMGSCHANFLSVDHGETTIDRLVCRVGALGLDVAALLALVADLLAAGRLLGAVTGVVARLAAVVALHAIDTLAWTG